MLQVLNAPGRSGTGRARTADRRPAAPAGGADAGIRPVRTGSAGRHDRIRRPRRHVPRRIRRGALEAAVVPAEQTFRDFVGRYWLAIANGIRRRFAGACQRVRGAEVDRALVASGTGSPCASCCPRSSCPPHPSRPMRCAPAPQQISQITSGANSRPGAAYSRPPHARRRGTPALAEPERPAARVAPARAGLAPGEVTARSRRRGRLFQLRDIEETGFTPPTYAAVEYAAYYMPGGRQAATLAQARGS